jgi:NitT/TauT family transport system ATP-binding protein
MLGVKIKGLKYQQQLDIAEKMISAVGLDGQQNKWAKYPLLSGGQLQRVAIARSLAANSDFLLMDEPFGALDIKTRYAMQDMIVNLSQTVNTTILLVTHDVSEAVFLGDVIYIMGSKPAKIIHKIENYRSPQTRNTEFRQSPEFFTLVNQIENYLHHA